MPLNAENASGKNNDKKPDILWPRVSFGRETEWALSEEFIKNQALSGDAFGVVSTDFQAITDDGFEGLAEFLSPTKPGGETNSGSASSTGFLSILDGTIAGKNIKDNPHESPFPGVDDIEKARNELSEELVKLNKTDALVEKLIAKAKEGQQNPRLQRALEEMESTQEKAQDIHYTANKLYKLRKTKEGEVATAMDFKNATIEVQDHTTALLNDSKSVRAWLPKEEKTKLATGK